MNSRCHCFTNNGSIVISRANKLFTLDTENLIAKDLIELPELNGEIPGSPRCLNRLFRRGIHHVIQLPHDTCIVVVKGSILRIEKGEQVKSIPHIEKRSGPLTLCYDGDSNLFWGEYFGNPHRDEVHIYSSCDGGLSFTVAYTFPPGSIRHIHGIFHDPYENTFWVTTGDTNEETGIWITDDTFRTLTKVIGGTQQTRAVQLLFTKSHVYFGSDTPLEKNHLYRMDKQTGQIEKLQELESSVFWACSVGEYLFFSTVVEPSRVNRCRDACIWGSKGGESWRCVARFRKDIWPMKLFQYGQIFFPSGDNHTGYLWFTPVATEKDHTLQRIEIEKIFSECQRPAEDKNMRLQG